MKRLFGYVIRLAAIVALVLWLADQPGTARLVWHGYVIETSAAFLGICALGVGFLFYLLFRLWHFVRHGPEIWRLGRKLKKLREGQEQLTRGLIAVAGGNAAEAGRLAVGARKLLGVTPATQLLQAQAAQLAGDHGSAREIFRALAEEPASAVLGYRGLIMEARREKKWNEVETLAGRMHHIKPDTPWLNLIRFEIAARRQDWDDATKALTLVSAARLLDAERVRRYRAAILVTKAQNEARQGKREGALDAAEQAAKQAPGWLPADINLAQQQAHSGHRRAAHRTIEKSWKLHPHPQLVAIYRAADADPIEAYKQIEKLCREHEADAASHLALAEAALAADIWGEARRHLIALISRGLATQSVYRMMARLERRESGDEQAALQWMTKAADAPSDPVWLCRTCGGTHAEWQAVCKHCSGFATLEWQSPGQSRAGMETPLLTSGWID